MCPMAAVEGWIQGGSRSRSLEVAQAAPSWKRLRTLLVVGCTYSVGEIGNRRTRGSTITRLVEWVVLSIGGSCMFSSLPMGN